MSPTDCKSKTPQEALENFEKAAKAFGLLEQHEGSIAYAIAYRELRKTKDELLVWLSYPPCGLTR